MTMRITVKNEDASRIARIFQYEYNPPNDSVLSFTKDLTPGEQAEFWIHQGRTITVEEVP